MLKKPMVSVIITSMGNEVLKKSIKSVLNQTYSNIEIIVVVDDAILFDDEILKNVRIISAKQAHNANASRNIGILAARGDCIALLDDDDLWHPEKINSQVERMQQFDRGDGEYYFSYGQTELVRNGVSRRGAYPKKGIKKDEGILNYFFGPSKGFIQSSSFFGDSQLFRTNMFNEKIIKHQDWDWLINVQKIPGVIIDFIPQVLTYYTVNSIGTSVGTKQRWKYSEKWFNNYEDTVTNSTKSNFYSKVILSSVLNDRSLSEDKKQHELKRILKIISVKHLFTYLRSLIKILIYSLRNKFNK